MTNLLSLNKLILITLFLLLAFNNFSRATDEPVDIWKKSENEKKDQDKIENDSETESLISIEESSDNQILISEEEVEPNESVVGLFDPEKNNFTLNMWIPSDGDEIKKILGRIDKIELSNFSKNLLFEILFTNSYPPHKNLSADEFLDMKIDWLIKNKMIDNLENLLQANKKVGEKPKAIEFLVEEYLSTADIKLACEKIKFVSRGVQNDFLDKFNIYCLINDDRKAEAQLMYDLLKERGIKDKFFENKINFLLGITNQTSQKINDKNLFNFYLSQITSNDFSYQPTEKTNKYIYNYLIAANLIKIENYEEEKIVSTYEKASAADTFERKEIFNIYKKINFNLNQLLNAEEVYKTLPRYKSRALVYQKILLTDSVEKKLSLAFLLKDLFDADNLSRVYSEELSNIINRLDKNSIPEEYSELVEKYSSDELGGIKNVKFDNDVIHKSKILKYFLEEDYSIKKTEKDVKSVYKKVKKNKKYFISIKDIIILESLKSDGITLPETLNYEELASKLTIPQSLYDLTKQQQVGLAMLMIVEIIGEDNIEDLDPETIYFINKILNELRLNKIRNNIISVTLPTRV